MRDIENEVRRAVNDLDRAMQDTALDIAKGESK